MLAPESTRRKEGTAVRDVEVYARVASIWSAEREASVHGLREMVVGKAEGHKGLPIPGAPVKNTTVMGLMGDGVCLLINHGEVPRRMKCVWNVIQDHILVLRQIFGDVVRRLG